MTEKNRLLTPGEIISAHKRKPYQQSLAEREAQDAKTARERDEHWKKIIDGLSREVLAMVETNKRLVAEEIEEHLLLTHDPEGNVYSIPQLSWKALKSKYLKEEPNE